MPLTTAQKEAVLFHLLTTTSSQTFNPSNPLIANGDQLLDMIKKASGKADLWNALGRGPGTPNVATNLAALAIVNAPAYDTVSNTVFQTTAGFWGGSREHPSVQTIMAVLGM